MKREELTRGEEAKKADGRQALPARNMLLLVPRSFFEEEGNDSEEVKPARGRGISLG